MRIWLIVGIIVLLAIIIIPAGMYTTMVAASDVLVSMLTTPYSCCYEINQPI